MMQLAVANEIPFHTVYLHALVRDEKGKKMSKTSATCIDPLETRGRIRRRRAALYLPRWRRLGRVLKLSRERITGYRNFGTKLWNAVRFAEMNEVFTENAAPQLRRVRVVYRRQLTLR